MGPSEGPRRGALMTTDVSEGNAWWCNDKPVVDTHHRTSLSGLVYVCQGRCAERYDGTRASRQV